MSKFIHLPIASSYNGEHFTGYDEAEHKRLDFAIPIDKIREIKDKSITGSLINLEPNAKERTYRGECLTEIIMENGQHYVVNVRTADIVNKINEIEGVEKKENKKILEKI